jgi:CheY-like chemotaxis protein
VVHHSLIKMTSETITILEDDAERVREMKSCLNRLLPSVEVMVFDVAAEMIASFRRHGIRSLLISLDHDLPIRRDEENRLIDCGTGREVADYLASLPPACPVIVHSSNIPCAAGMMLALKDAGWACHQVHPRDHLSWIGDEWAEAVRRLSGAHRNQV